MTDKEFNPPKWLWRTIAEFDCWAMENRETVQNCIIEIADAEVARFEDAKSQLPEKPAADFLPEELSGKEAIEYMAVAREEAFEYAKKFRNILASSESTTVSISEKVATLARIHDMAIENDADRAKRQGWQLLAPKFDSPLHEIYWVTLVLPQQIIRHQAYHDDTGISQIERYWQDIQDEFEYTPISRTTTQDTSPKKKGRKPLNPEKVELYREIVEAWEEFRSQELGNKIKFCQEWNEQKDDDISPEFLNRAQTYLKTRERRRDHGF